jgi:hypothetical protein
LESVFKTQLDNLDAVTDGWYPEYLKIATTHLNNLSLGEMEELYLCVNKAYIEEMMKSIDDMPNIYLAHSDDPEASKAFDVFEADTSDHLKILFCINIFNQNAWQSADRT